MNVWSFFCVLLVLLIYWTVYLTIDDGGRDDDARQRLMIIFINCTGLLISVGVYFMWLKDRMKEMKEPYKSILTVVVILGVVAFLGWTLYLVVEEFIQTRGISRELLSSLFLMTITIGLCVFLTQGSLLLTKLWLRPLLKVVSVLVVLLTGALAGFVLFYRGRRSDLKDTTFWSLVIVLFVNGLIASICMLKLFYQPDYNFLSQFYSKVYETKYNFDENMDPLWKEIAQT